MGADLGPLPLISGAVEYLRNPQNTGTSIVLIGDEPLIREHLKGLGVNGSLPLSVVHASEVVDMHVAATEGLKKKDSSMAVAVRMHKEGLVDAVISAGNTGAVMANAVLTLGRLRGVSRPAIAAAMPNRLERWTLLLDVGANVDVRPDHILQFAQMGVSYAEDILKIQSPRVGLLSIGEESVKGNELTSSSHELLVRGKAITFVGNIILKFAESMKGFLESRLHKQISSNPFSKAGAILMGPFLRRMRRVFDYSEYGGAPLLGINGNCVISHGKSSAKAINNAVKIAVEMVRTDAKGHIERRIAGNQQEIIGQ